MKTLSYEQVEFKARTILGNCYGKCKEYVDYISDRIPELEKVRGFYHCPLWGKRQHWWLKDKDGNIFDPTVSQFPSKGIGTYEEYDPEIHLTPIGKCLNCGDLIYESKGYGDSACDEECYSKILSSFRRVVR